MLHFGMEDRIGGEGDGTNVITLDYRGCETDMQVTEQEA